MSVLTDRLPTRNRAINPEPAGPLATRPFGLDALANVAPVAIPSQTFTVDPASQLSVIDGEVCLDTPAHMKNTICNTESDGRDSIGGVDEDQDDD
ncbi:putative ATP-grasp-modified RiPP [Streptomyces celluloflavus]|uniref:putative ATP-grasp-modified RiPP n=1 Tax=Streptomyces celluloflavus TaxID=58344 RepID=UPI0034608C93|nr:putative ATP-grasp-modified RiPP [Streptomyces celluloflavus]WSK17199.1 putative ATP-grasp-modified RiPP [Streptomyces celluloflavus]